METPTPETNAAIESENADPWDLAADLERRLIIAREALAKILNSDMDPRRVEPLIKEALTQTAPKP